MVIEKLRALAAPLCRTILLKGSSTLALASVMSFLATAPAKADLIIDFFDNFGGSTPTGTSNPLLTAIIKNVNGGAEIKVESFLEPPSNTEYVDQITFYLSQINPPNPIPAFESSNCSQDFGDFSCLLTSFETGNNVNQPDFNPTTPTDAINAALNLPNPNSGGTDGFLRFDANDKGTFYVAGLTEQMFLTFIAIDNNGAQQTLYAGAKINSITCASGTGTCSTSIGGSRRKVPGPLPLVGAAAAFGFSRRLRRRLSRPEITV